MELRDVTIHGRRVAYRTEGSGRLVVLVHGISQDSRTWEPLAEHLRHSARLLAPDLPGHGRSQSPGGDHSLGAYASGVRDLLLALDEPGATIVGHSLGGGVALQFAYQFPDMVDRLVLVDSGGLGRDVSALLRAAVLPGAHPVIGMLSSARSQRAAAAVSRGLSFLGLRLGTDLGEAWRGISALADPDARVAFLRTARATMELRGQMISAGDRLYLASALPTLIIWGEQDRIIPVAHARDAHRQIAGSRLAVFPGAGHFPHIDEPAGVSRVLSDFLDGTEPAELPRERWSELLRRGAPVEPAVAG